MAKAFACSVYAKPFVRSIDHLEEQFMQRVTLWLLVAFATLAFCTPSGAQEKQPLIPIQMVNKGMQYPLTIEVGLGKDLKQTTFYGFHPGQQVAASGTTLTPGTHTVYVRHSTRGFPQMVQYILKNKDNSIAWEGANTVDHKLITVSAGQTLSIVVNQPTLSYNGARVRVPGVDVEGAVIGTRPYWFYFANPGKYAVDAPEQYCNGMFFLADPAIGIKGVSRDMAKKLVANFKSNGVNAGNDHRGGCHWSFVHATTPDGKVPAQLLTVTEDQWAVAFEKAFNDLFAHNFHRPISAEEMEQIRSEGWLPDNYPKGVKVMTMAEDLELAKLYRTKWLQQVRAKDLEEAKKKK